MLYSAIACNLDADLLAASLPLFQSERVEAIEWSFDALFRAEQLPDWFAELLQAYSREGRLIGHGVFFSLFSGKWSEAQAGWLRHLKKTAADFPFDHVTEHFGFMTGADFHQGAPMSIPFTPATLAIGQDRLKRIQEACQCPVGLENLAFSYSPEEVKRHGAFLEKLVEPVNGFIILDLHNLFCQLHNFDIDFEDLLPLYPLERVREIHISGGSWDEVLPAPGQKVRRDTHDQAVPEEVFDLLVRALPRCPNLKFVVLEQIGNTLHTDESRQAFQSDFFRLEKIVQSRQRHSPNHPKEEFGAPTGPLPPNPLENELLHRQQKQLAHILETASDSHHAQTLLRESELAHSDWNIEFWKPYMLETALRIAQKWKKGWGASVMSEELQERENG